MKICDSGTSFFINQHADSSLSYLLNEVTALIRTGENSWATRQMFVKQLKGIQTYTRGQCLGKHIPSVPLSSRLSPASLPASLGYEGNSRADAAWLSQRAIHVLKATVKALPDSLYFQQRRRGSDSSFPWMVSWLPAACCSPVPGRLSVCQSGPSCHAHYTLHGYDTSYRLPFSPL